MTTDRQERHGRRNSLTIQTAEGVVFSLLLAGPVSRLLAWLVDGLIILAALQLTLGLLSRLGLLQIDLGGALYYLLSFTITVAYSMTLEWFGRGQTIGKRVLRLRVMDRGGFRLQFSQVALRNLLRIVDLMPPTIYLVGGVVSLFSRYGQRLGDIAANTIVVVTPKTILPDLDSIRPDKYNSFRDYPHIEARLRQNTAPNEAAIALQAVLRRNELNPEARVKLFREIAARLRAIAEFPEEAIEGLSDEQYVRNAVEVLFKTREPLAARRLQKSAA